METTISRWQPCIGIAAVTAAPSGGLVHDIVMILVVAVDKTFSANGAAGSGAAIQASISKIALAPYLAAYRRFAALPMGQFSDKLFRGLLGARQDVPKLLLERS